MSARRLSGSVFFVLVCAAGEGAFAQYAAPVGYYNGVENVADALKPQGDALRTALRAVNAPGRVAGTRARNYGDARYSAAYTDVDPANPSHILTVYSRRSISSTWDSGATWNREHLWPQSRIGASASNGTTNIASDQFELRPAASNENSSRGNNSYGGAYGSGTARNINGYFYPGDVEAGDVARAAFYMATQYTTIKLVNGAGNPSNNEMGDLASLLTYHYADVPDTFEMRRNHAIYGGAGLNSPAITNPYAQGNRNPYVDHPEWVWSAFVDQANDTRLRLGTANADGSSTATVNFGRVLRNAPVPTQTLTLSKDGVDGTYYSVTTAGDATSSITGRNNAFAMNTTGSRSLTVGLASTVTSTAGLKTGTVTVDNLDITGQGGAGRGANDGNDVANIQLMVLNPSNPSFGSTDTNSLTLNFGTVNLGSKTSLPFSIDNLASALGASLTAGLDLDSFSKSFTGSADAFTTTLASFKTLVAGSDLDYTATFTATTLGAFSTTYTLNFSDEDLPGTQATSSMTLILTGNAIPEPAALAALLPAVLLISRRRR